MGKSESEEYESSASEEEAPPAKKKQKVDKKAEKSKAKAKKEDADPSWTLDTKRFVKVREFRNKVMVDIREFYEKDGDLLPGKKGIALSAAQWKKLVGFMDEINEEVNKH